MPGRYSDRRSELLVKEARETGHRRLRTLALCPFLSFFNLSDSMEVFSPVNNFRVGGLKPSEPLKVEMWGI